MLLIHGTADEHTPPEHAARLARANPRASVWMVAGAHHSAAWAVAGDAFPRRILAHLRAAGVPR